MRLDHPFKPSFIDIETCDRCKFPKNKHGKDAVCDSCANTGVLQIIDGIAMCRNCVADNIAASLPSVPVSELTASSVKNTVLNLTREIDNSIRYSQDMFNAKTPAIIELESAIQADDSIPANQKNFKLIEVLIEQFNIQKKAIFEHREQIMETQMKLEKAQTEQKVIHEHMNRLASTLQASERAKLKLEDLNYKPEAPKSIKPKVAKADKPKAIKISIAEVTALCNSVGISAAQVQSIIIGKQCTLLEAVSEVLNSQNKK